MLPLDTRWRRVLAIAPAFKGGAEEHQDGNDQQLQARNPDMAAHEQQAHHCQQQCDAEHESAPHDAYGSGSMMTAVPYATTSLIVWPISEESKRIMTMALACMMRAFFTMRSTA